MTNEQFAESEPKRFYFRRPFLFVAFAGLGCWGLTLLAVAGGYYAGDVVVTWMAEPNSAVAYSGETEAPAVGEDLDAIARDLSRIAPAAGSAQDPTAAE